MQLSRGAWRLFKLIDNFIRKYKRSFFAGQRWIAGRLKCSVRSVKYWLAELLSSGYVQRKRRSQRTAEITILRSIFAPQIAPQIAPRIKEEPSVVASSKEEYTLPLKKPQEQAQYHDERRQLEEAFDRAQLERLNRIARERYA